MSLRPSKPADVTGDSPGRELKWDHLTETEKSASSLGVDPDSWKPIAFLNNAHHETLLKANALDDGLAKKLEVRQNSQSPNFVRCNSRNVSACVRQAYKAISSGAA